ncbi:MAG TPA: hypothetical protein DER02_03990 [Gammaproteobacteria bacterium]|nr:hypothetical protein [Gammaproteobacteria bacterium]
MMSGRQKDCAICSASPNVLFRCRYGVEDWQFLCDICLEKVKSSFVDSYIYGGTWKRKKK